MKYLKAFYESNSSLISKAKDLIDVSDIEKAGFSVRFIEEYNNIIIKVVKEGTYEDLMDKYKDLFNRRFGVEKAKAILSTKSELLFEWGSISKEFLELCNNIDKLFVINYIYVDNRYTSLNSLTSNDIIEDQDLDCIYLEISKYKIKNDIEDLCEAYLSFLVDDGFNISITENIDYIILELKNNKKVNYLDIKDHFITFIEKINSIYRVFKRLYFRVNDKQSEVVCNIEEVINDKISGNIIGIKILIYY